MNIPVEALGQFGTIAKNGSPLILSSVGRLFGLGEAEQSALVRGEFPRWSIFVIGLGLGAVGGVFLQRKFPEYVNKAIGR